MAIILIAEIDFVTASNEAYFLLREGFEVRTVKSGKELIEEAEKIQPDLIIMDVLLPEMNGIEAARALRANEKTAQTPILITSPLDLHERALRAGANAFLLKPVNAGKLMETVRTLLATVR